MRRLRLVLALIAVFDYGKGPLTPPGEGEGKSGNTRCPSCGGVLRRRGDKSHCRKCARVIHKPPGDG